MAAATKSSIGLRVLIAGGVVLLVAMLVLWKELGASSEAAEVPPAPLVVQRLEPPKLPDVKSHAEQAAAPPLVAGSAADPEPPAKVAIQSNDFFYHFSELVVPNLSRNAIKCVESQNARFEMNASSKFLFDIEVKNGDVLVTNVRLDHSNIADPAMNNCFAKQMVLTSWHDDTLPDYVEKDREVKFSPERGMKKYRQDNINYVGKSLEAPH